MRLGGGTPRPRTRGTTLAEHVSPKSNGLNLVRLVMASSVIFWHSFPLTGRTFPFAFPEQFLGQFSVDGFFAISGFLLAGSWLHRPKLISYLRNRALRIFPAFWVCLALTALVLAPLTTLLQQGPWGGTQWSSAVRYVLNNADLSINQFDVAGTPLGVPFPGIWNGSLWTLKWEFIAYLVLAAVGLVGGLRHRIIALLGFGVLWAVNLAQVLDLVDANYYLKNGGRLGFMFMCGVLLCLYARNLPAARWVPVACLLALPLTWFLPDYRLLGGPLLAYLVIWVGGAIHRPLLQLNNRDVSYGVYIYAFPIQQALAIAGLTMLPPLVFGTLSLALTIPIATLSWVLIERPALKLKDRGWRRRPRMPLPPREIPAEPQLVPGGSDERSA